MKLPFKKGNHVRVIEVIAQGLCETGVLNNYLELGIKTGTCFNRIAPLVKGKAYAVDIRNDFKKHCQGNKNLIWHGCSTNDFFLKIDKNIRFDLVFIDANHRKDNSLIDFENVWPMVNSNGIVCLHDTYPPSQEFIDDHCHDCWETAVHIKEHHKEDAEIVTLPFFYGVSIVRKANKQLMWK